MATSALHFVEFFVGCRACDRYCLSHQRVGCTDTVLGYVGCNQGLGGRNVTDNPHEQTARIRREEMGEGRNKSKKDAMGEKE